MASIIRSLPVLLRQENDMENFVNILFNGLSLSSIILLTSLGLSITFGLMGVINMAHGEFVMIGAYMTYVTQQIFYKLLPPPLLNGKFPAVSAMADSSNHNVPRQSSLPSCSMKLLRAWLQTPRRKRLLHRILWGQIGNTPTTLEANCKYTYT